MKKLIDIEFEAYLKKKAPGLLIDLNKFIKDYKKLVKTEKNKIEICKRDKRNVIQIPMSQKISFIQIHIDLFHELEDLVGDEYISSCKPKVVKKIAEYAKLILGYSEKTALIDIVNVLYGIYLNKE